MGIDEVSGMVRYAGYFFESSSLFGFAFLPADPLREACEFGHAVNNFGTHHRFSLSYKNALTVKGGRVGGVL